VRRWGRASDAVCQSHRVIDEFAKAYLHEELRWGRAAVVGKLDGLGEYDVRRPMSRTGTNLLGLVKHLTLSEARYFGAIFDRPFPEPLPTFDDDGFRNRDHLWVSERESRGDVVDGYLCACRHADATIEALPIDAPGRVPWWPRPEVKLLNVLVHVVTETNRHLGHADILREQLDGALDSDPTPASEHEEADWAAHRATIEQAALRAT
jgi:hypothetical protein